MTTASETRAAAKSKLDRLLTADPHQKVDGSDWTPPEAMENQAKTGMRPLSRSKYKKGGRVEGETAAVHAGRKPRAKGGKIDWIAKNSPLKPAEMADLKAENAENIKKGFAPYPTVQSNQRPRDQRHFARGGGVVDDLVNVDMKKANELRDGVKHDGGFAKGGAAHGADCRCAKCHGGKAYAKGGSVALEGGTRPTGGRMPRKSGGRAKKGTTVNVIIAGGMGKPAMPPPGAMPPPPGGPVGLHQAPPPVAAPAPMGPPASGAPPPMMRKRGGRTGYPIESGAGGALGRLEKVKAYG